MRLLVVSNLYPPYVVGGYELRCSWVCEELARRGHQVDVICSTFGRAPGVPARETINQVNIHRVLTDWFGNIRATETSLRERIMHVARDLCRMAKLINSTSPHVACLWNLEHLSGAILPTPAAFGIPAVSWIEDLWMTRVAGSGGRMDRGYSEHWPAASKRSLFQRFRQRLHRALYTMGVPALRAPGTMFAACFVSKFQQDANAGTTLRFQHKYVIRGAPLPCTRAITDEHFQPLHSTRPLRLIYCGALTECRRLHVLIQSLALLPRQERLDYRLTVVGSAPGPADQEYLDSVLALVRKENLEPLVQFLGPLSHSRVLDLFLEHHVYVLCSARAEGAPIAMAESMLHGCLAITTGAGGAQELGDACGALSFSVDDSDGLKNLLRTLAGNPAKLMELRRNCHQAATRELAFNRMVDAYEAVLAAAAVEK